MKRLSYLMAFVLATLTTIAILAILAILVSTLNDDEKILLKSLETIKGSVETGVSYEKYMNLVTNCKVEINIYNRNKDKNECFIKIAQLCFSKYKEAGENWSCKTKNMVEADKNLSELESMGRNDERYENLKEVVEREIRLAKLCDSQLNTNWAEGAQHLDEVYKCLKDWNPI